MLVDKLGDVVDLIVDDEENVLLGVVLGNILIRVFLRHFDEISTGADFRGPGKLVDNGRESLGMKELRQGERNRD